MSLKQVHEDARGTLYILTFGDKEYLLMFTKKGFKRGGDYHQSIQHDVVLSGRVEFEYVTDKDWVEVILLKGQSISFKAMQPHMLTALTDCLVLEWLEGPFEKQYYEPFKKLIKCEA